MVKMVRSPITSLSALPQRGSTHCFGVADHPQFAGMYACAVSDPKTPQIVEGADLVLGLGGVNLNDITTASYSAQLDLSRFVTVGLNDVRIGDEVVASPADVLSELAKPNAADGEPIR